MNFHINASELDRHNMYKILILNCSWYNFSVFWKVQTFSEIGVTIKVTNNLKTIEKIKTENINVTLLLFFLSYRPSRDHAK